MKYLKIYENLGRIEVGDWCLMTHWWAGQHIHNFIDNTPGQIIDINLINNSAYNSAYEYKVKCTNVPKNLKLGENGFWIKDFIIGGIYSLKDFIVYWSKNKKDVETYIVANKYNL